MRKIAIITLTTIAGLLLIAILLLNIAAYSGDDPNKKIILAITSLVATAIIVYFRRQRIWPILAKRGTLLILAVLVLIGSAFYWYEWRPRQIASKCSEKAVEGAKKVEGFDDAVEFYDVIYKACTRKEGL